MFVRFTFRYLAPQSCIEQFISQPVRVRLHDSQSRGENARFMAASGMQRIQAVVTQFVDIDDSPLGPREIHLE
jgi:hypothetical protein